MTPQELKHIAATLAEIQKKGSGFGIPKGYFKEVENSVTTRLFVDLLPKNSGYHTPDAYFKQVESHVMSRIDTKQSVPDGYFDTIEYTVFERLALEKKSKVFSLRKYWVPAAVAASLVLLVTIYNPFNNKQNIEVADIEAWIEEGNLDMDSYEIADALNADLENITIENNIDKDDLENYIDDAFSEESFYN